MAKSVSAKGLFRATKPKADKGAPLPMDMPEHKPEAVRDPLDFDPTPPDATVAFLRREMHHIRKHGDIVSEPAVGAGHIAYVLRERGFKVRAGDMMQRGYRGISCIGSFYENTAAARIHITNPPYNEINARDGHGRWLRHAIKGSDYIALLLNADWAAARINGMDELFLKHPPSVEYLCCWKIDFRGGGSPPQRNSWFVWDVNRPASANEWVRRRLYRDQPDPDQAGFDGV